MGTLIYVMLFSILLEFSLTRGQDVVYSLLEERDSDYLIGNVARDFNLSSFIINAEDLNNIKYSLFTPGDPYKDFTDYFRINNRTSDFYTTVKKLDREHICAFLPTCEIIVLDVTAQSMVGTFFKKIRVKVLLQDINDNKPTFSTNETSLQFSESSVIDSSQPLDGATDSDSGSNSIQTYSILEKDTPFSVDFQKFVDGKSTVALILKRKLDRETKDFYELTIIAKDGGFESKNGTLKVYVVVTDVNDNTPKFEKPTYNVTINESTTIGKVILDVSAVDPDLGNNGKISYRLSPHQDNLIRSKFVVNATTGDLSINQSLFYESGKFYKVIIEASDHGIPPLISQTTIFVYILDSVNDPPIISINLLSNSDKAKISENASRGAAVAHVEVTDRDTGTNGNFECTVDNHYFKLDSLESDNSKTREFKVVVDKQLDREDIDTHTVTVICQDGGSPPKTTTAQFYVIVLDENDHAPTFGQENFIAYVDENNNIGASITQVLASDADKGINAQVVFSLANLQGHDFRIDPNSGHLFVHFQLDRENISQYTFNVIAMDKGSSPKSASARVIVIVKDKNDNKPKFSQDVYTFEMLENQEVNSFVGRVYADDPDEKENGTVEFILSPENPVDLPFIVLKNGTLFNVEVLNHETKPHGYHFNIIAMDGGNPRLNSTARVTVFVNDQNDNDPVILFPNVNNRSVTILYDVAVQSLITRVKAIDMDTGLNAKLTYSIVDSHMKHIFHMNPETGEITLARQLTMDDIKSYTFSILVEDRGIPKRFAEENLTIIVISQGLIPSSQHSEQDYLLIVVVILCVTVLLSGTIILIICLIKVKRINFGKKKSPKPIKNHTLQNGINKEMYDAIEKNLENDSKNPAEKKVSFSLENLADESSTDFPVDRQIAALPSSDVQELLDKIAPPPSKPERLAKVHNGSYHGNKQPSQLKTLQLHQKHLQTHDKSWSNHNGMPPSDMYKKQEDNHSETSGETTTSDSGRGGSESDIQSNGGLSHSYEIDFFKGISQPQSSPEKAISIGHLNQANLQRNTEKYNSHKHSVHPDFPISFSNSAYLPNRTSRHLPYSDNYKHQRTSRWTAMNDVVSGSMATIDDYDDDTTTSGSYTVDEDSLDTDVRLGNDCIV